MHAPLVHITLHMLHGPGRCQLSKKLSTMYNCFTHTHCTSYSLHSKSFLNHIQWQTAKMLPLFMKGFVSNVVVNDDDDKLYCLVYCFNEFRCHAIALHCVSATLCSLQEIFTSEEAFLNKLKSLNEVMTLISYGSVCAALLVPPCMWVVYS